MIETETRRSAALLAFPLSRLRWPFRLGIGIAVVLAVAIAAYFGDVRHPDVSLPTEDEASAQIALRFHLPADADDVLIGDYLIERFYMVDLDTGQRKVGDVCKGRVKNVIVSRSGDWSGFDYRLLLDRAGLEGERDRIRAFVSAVAPPDPELNAEYAGLWVQGGPTGFFPFNYTGRLPDSQVEFSGPEGEDVFSFMEAQDYAQASKALRVVGVEENNYLLRTTADSAYYRDIFRTQRAVLVGQLIVVDATSPAQVATYREIAWSLPRR